MNRKVNLKIALLAVFASIGILIAGAAVYVYRSSDISININDSTEASGIAVVGFYVGGNDHLPTMYSLDGAITYDSNQVDVTLPTPVYTSDDGTTQVTLYSKATITATVTVGQWEFDNLVGFGRPGDDGGGTWSVTIKVEDASQQRNPQGVR